MGKCELCNKEFKRKYDLERHLKRKIPCNNIIQCNRCLVIFKTKQKLTNHQNRKTPCEKVDLEQEVKDLKNEIEKLKLEKEKTSLNQTIINNNTQNNFFIDKWDKLFYDRAMVASLNIKNNGLDRIVNEEIKKTESFRDTKDNLNLHKEREMLPFYNHIKAGKNIYLYIIKVVCMNIKYPDNWIFIYNKLTEEITVRIDNEFKELNTNILRLIYDILKVLVEDELIDENLKNIYKTFIERYENNYKPDDEMKEDYEEELTLFIERSEKNILEALKKLEKELIQKIKLRNILNT